MRKLIDFADFLFEEFNVGNISIDNMENYLSHMTRGFVDKLFFINRINLDVLVDFGSADGQMLNRLHRIKPNMELIGYDKDESMVTISKEKYNDIKFTDSWDDVITMLNKQKDKTKGILLSSVIHEVYSYSSGADIKRFWNEQVFNDIFDYVIIRDMIPSVSFDKMNLSSVQKIKEKSDPERLKEFEDVWGDIGQSFRTLLHWLLKYRYVDNWNRELKENYLPLSLEHLKTKIPSNWKITYENHYLYSYIRDKVKKDFGVDLEEPTHLKMIIKKA